MVYGTSVLAWKGHRPDRFRMSKPDLVNTHRECTVFGMSKTGPGDTIAENPDSMSVWSLVPAVRGYRKLREG